MKKLIFLISAILIFSMSLISCKKDTESLTTEKFTLSKTEITDTKLAARGENIPNACPVVTARIFLDPPNSFGFMQGALIFNQSNTTGSVKLVDVTVEKIMLNGEHISFIHFTGGQVGSSETYFDLIVVDLNTVGLKVVAKCYTNQNGSGEPCSVITDSGFVLR